MIDEKRVNAVREAFSDLSTEEKDFLIDDFLKILYEETVGDAAEYPSIDDTDFDISGPNAIYRYALNLALVISMEREENDTLLYKKVEDALWELVHDFDKNRE